MRFSRTLVLAGILSIFSSVSAAGQKGSGAHPTPPPEVAATLLTATIKLDGRLDELAWQTPAPATGFRQSQPNEGQPATQKTEVRFAYDESAVYIGARMFDDQGAKGVRTRLMRRDALNPSDSDLLLVTFDSYHSHNQQLNFWVNPSGSKRDGAGDPTWDPVWEVATQIDSLGWTAEMRIPFNQLNFSRATDQIWGLQIFRSVHRLNEHSHFAWTPSNEPGGPQRYGHLNGIRIADRPRGMEIMPYTVARARYIKPADAANPFTRPSDRDYRVGGDVKYRLTSNLTLNATFNPDFGQVEVDPAVVNLSAFETFFQERRPFFIENQSNFGFGSFNCYFCNNVSNLQLFYPRRIGRAPQLFPAGTYVDQPENATILAAGKVTGRLANDYQIGILNAVTRREVSRIISVEPSTGQETRFSREAEPLTNYMVARPRKEFKAGAHSVGAILTSVDRFTDDSLALFRLPRSARGIGLDWFTSRKNRAYTFMGQYAVSDIRGSASAMERIQRSSARYFQRPDRENDPGGVFSNAFDPAARRLTGYGGYARAAKESGTFLWESAVNYRSPGFEVNDISFLDRSDLLWMNASVARSISKPGRIYRNYFAVFSAQQEFNYDGDLTDREYSTGLFGQLLNYWQVNVFTIRSTESFDHRATRGGPVVKRQGYRYSQAFIGTDPRKAISFSTNPNLINVDRGPDGYRMNLNVTYKPSSNVQLSVGPSFGQNGTTAQFVTSGPDSTATDFFGRRYIFSELIQRSFSMSTRANVTFTPNLTLEVFAQPLIASADYTVFREYAGPRQSAVRDFRPGSELTSALVNNRRRYTVDVDGPTGPAQAISFFDPNFNFRALRGNAVMRWEYRPGSTLFFVWQQNRSETAGVGDFDFNRDRRALFSARPDNIFLLKATYWTAF